MVRGFCKNCGNKTMYKRALGLGTVLMILLTMGFWILVIPFYPKRCKYCGATPRLFQQTTF